MDETGHLAASTNPNSVYKKVEEEGEHAMTGHGVLPITLLGIIATVPSDSLHLPSRTNRWATLTIRVARKCNDIISSTFLTYWSVSEKSLNYVFFFFKLELRCSQTWWDSPAFSIPFCLLHVWDPGPFLSTLMFAVFTPKLRFRQFLRS